MKSFWFNSFLFLMVFLLVSELGARLLHISTDAPKTYKSERGTIRYFPNQEGNWAGGAHKWYVNEWGFPGSEIPKSMDNLIGVIGDSYIQNFMNPDSCRQEDYLKEFLPGSNVVEFSRAGANVLEYFELAEQMDSLNPEVIFMYAAAGDFNCVKTKSRREGMLVDVHTGELTFPRYEGSAFKDFIYNFKFVYYLYRKHHGQIRHLISNKKKRVEKKALENQVNIEELRLFLDFINSHYNTEKVVFVFRPGIDSTVNQIVQEKGFATLTLQNPENQNWSLPKDSHWSCLGHREAAKQVSQYLKKRNFQ